MKLLRSDPGARVEFVDCVGDGVDVDDMIDETGDCTGLKLPLLFVLVPGERFVSPDALA